MNRKKSLLPLALLTFVLSGLLIACDKDNDNTSTNPSNCDVRGSYSGTYTNQLSQTASVAYILTDDNFIKGSANLTSSPTAFGSYAGTCDSIRMRSWNSINNNYYYFEGKFSNTRTTITGIYKNLTTTSETGTFTLTKQ
jgi:hypothetical protein